MFSEFEASMAATGKPCKDDGMFASDVSILELETAVREQKPGRAAEQPELGVLDPVVRPWFTSGNGMVPVACMQRGLQITRSGCFCLPAIKNDPYTWTPNWVILKDHHGRPQWQTNGKPL